MLDFIGIEMPLRGLVVDHLLKSLKRLQTLHNAECMSEFQVFMASVSPGPIPPIGGLLADKDQTTTDSVLYAVVS